MSGLDTPRKRSFWTLHRHKMTGGFFALIGFSLTGLIAYWSAGTKPPTAPESVMLVILSGMFQFIGVSFFSKGGRADPTLARIAVRDLYDLWEMTKDIKEQAQKSFENESPTAAKSLLGRLSVNLEWIQIGIWHATNNWVEFHPDAWKRMKENNK